MNRKTFIKVLFSTVGILEFYLYLYLTWASCPFLCVPSDKKTKMQAKDELKASSFESFNTFPVTQRPTD